MTLDNLFKLAFVVCVIAAYTIRTPYLKASRKNKISDSRVTPLESLFAILAFVGIVLIPFVYVFTPVFSVADYALPDWVGVVGIVVFLIALWLLWRAHADLGLNWSATVRFHDAQTLVTNGVYRLMRHPIYAAHWLWCIAQACLLHNWVAGFAGLVLFLPIYLYRTPREEQMMRDHFGEAYTDYTARTPRILPRLESWS